MCEYGVMQASPGHGLREFSPISLCVPTCFPILSHPFCAEQADCGGLAGCSPTLWEKVVSWGMVSSPAPDLVCSDLTLLRFPCTSTNDRISFKSSPV